MELRPSLLWKIVGKIWCGNVDPYDCCAITVCEKLGGCGRHRNDRCYNRPDMCVNPSYLFYRKSSEKEIRMILGSVVCVLVALCFFEFCLFSGRGKMPVRSLEMTSDIGNQKRNKVFNLAPLLFLRVLQVPRRVVFSAICEA